jgi:hypothetical protein
MTLNAATVALVALITVVGVLVVRFERFCFGELATTRDDQLRYLTRRGWLAVIACVIPIGGVVFLYFGRWP